MIHSARKLTRRQDMNRRESCAQRSPAESSRGVSEHSTEFVSESMLEGMAVGTGLAIFTKTILPAIEAAEQEVIFATCFWAPSTSRNLLGLSLVRLSEKALRRKDGTTIRVRICFSSKSLLENILYTTPTNGQVYGKEDWAPVLGLPHPEQIAGLDLEVTRKYFRPLGIIHSKFVVIDRQLAILPSCNVSWEAWLEAAVVVRGPVVGALMIFYSNFWEKRLPAIEPQEDRPKSSTSTTALLVSNWPGLSRLKTPGCQLAMDITTSLLPSPHTPTLLPPFLKLKSPPDSASSTQLNIHILNLFNEAISSISLFTPNITSSTVLLALKKALGRGVSISINTNRHLMTLEQLATSGTTTPRCAGDLVRAHKRMLRSHKRSLQNLASDPESATTDSSLAPGRLRIAYFEPHAFNRGSSGIGKLEFDGNKELPVKSHVKCTMVDGKSIVLGSGNMDAASWYTSQELGIAFHDRGEGKVQATWEQIDIWFRDKADVFYDVDGDGERMYEEVLT